MTGSGKNGSCSSFPSMQVFNKTKPPGQICRMSVYFMIHQVSQSDHSSHKAGRDHQFVECPKHAPMANPLRIKIDSDDYTQRSPMTGKSTLPNLQNFERIRQIIIRSIKQTMPQTGTDNCSQHRINQQGIDPCRIEFLSFPHLFHDLITDQETDGKRQSVPAYLTRTDGKDGGVSRPGNKIKHNYYIN